MTPTEQGILAELRGRLLRSRDPQERRHLGISLDRAQHAVGQGRRLLKRRGAVYIEAASWDAAWGGEG